MMNSMLFIWSVGCTKPQTYGVLSWLMGHADGIFIIGLGMLMVVSGIIIRVHKQAARRSCVSQVGRD